MEKITDQELLDLIDGKYSLERSRSLKDQIENNDFLKKRYQVLFQIHNELEKTMKLETSEHFVDRVIANLHNPQFISELSPGLQFKPRNLLTFLTIFAGILVGIYILGSGIVAIPFFESFSIKPLDLKGTEINLNPLVDGITTSVVFKAFLIVDIILGWFFLDKLVLKPYFSSRRKKMAY